MENGNDIDSDRDDVWTRGRGIVAQLEAQKKLREKAGRKLRARDLKRKRAFERVRAHLEQIKRNELTDAEHRKIEVFGQRAIARTPKQARELGHIRGEIAWEREQRALAQFQAPPLLQHWLDENLGFKPGANTLSAAHKGLRAEAAYLMSRRMRRFFRRNKDRLFFYFVTIIHDGWRTLDRETVINLKDIKTRVRNVLRPHQLHYLGVIEFDAVSNYPAEGQGICIMPHVHMVVWSDTDLTPEKLMEKIRKTTRLTSEWGAPTVNISSRLTGENVVHKAAYMFEQPFKCKRQGPKNPETGKRKLHTVYKAVPPHLTLRLSEILANCTLKDLIISSGDGLDLKGSLVKALRAHQRKVGLGKKPVELTAADAFRQLRANTKRGLVRSGISITR